MDDSPNRVRIAPDAIEVLDEPRGPNAQEAAFFRKIADLVNAEAPDPYVAFNALYGAIIATVAGMSRHHRHEVVKHTLTHFRGHVTKAAAARHEGQQ
jgi:hypothetical protein